ncbi:bifunctional phosphoribosylaminoimidazolecarboxamide formyltransferase/IMP cyclohydrolase [Hyphobacterium sp. HN65]|uniref:Bifunctional purine biosynthesis protein PurH n=1 Tax=Hyphobacterium lacteum TaxID=3116575 RepID=A0ABU7LSJ2_9PROT|nr:bifunctional phosphoribosylaminoimidazolecarboxamide formyltransferase/IMP cyclohydrolase [Hyphobacterium sp. HN65]MEE2526554.1 bifunctional phosphoribosylaminoimidazolecarboxamide formyltransferase/IMP cyclohydrolase [Hyphobacterium sp. HN65]
MSSPDLVTIRRALISLSDKDGLEERARRLVALGVEILSTGGTLRALQKAGIAARDVSEVTGFPEMMDGRLKTLHPVVHGGLLGRRSHEADRAAMSEHNIPEIDLLFVNLYPFEATVDAGEDFETCIENIDIGGPAMLRAAAKNHPFVAVCVDNDDADAVLDAMDENNGATPLTLRKALAAKAYARTGAYDAAVSGWFAAQIGEASPDYRTFGGQLISTLRYGENPHQNAAFYAAGSKRPGVATARIVQGKALSYNNLADADAAFELAAEFIDEPVCVIVKHANPCGVALGKTVRDAWDRALMADPVSAFGGIVAFNREIDAETADALTNLFLEVIIAPGASKAALEILANKANLRVMLTGEMPDPSEESWTAKTVAGGMLVQERDRGQVNADALKTVTEQQPDDETVRDMLFAWTVCKHVKSNAIVYAKDGMTTGIGMGQTSRVEAARLAARKAVDIARENGWDQPATIGSACASDAFFPFADGLLAAVEAGATSVIQPGGSVRDADVIAAAEEAGVTMVFTGMRHFRH